VSIVGGCAKLPLPLPQKALGDPSMRFHGHTAFAAGRGFSSSSARGQPPRCSSSVQGRRARRPQPTPPTKIRIGFGRGPLTGEARRRRAIGMLGRVARYGRRALPLNAKRRDPSAGRSMIVPDRRSGPTREIGDHPPAKAAIAVRSLDGVVGAVQTPAPASRRSRAISNAGAGTDQAHVRRTRPAGDGASPSNR